MQQENFFINYDEFINFIHHNVPVIHVSAKDDPRVKALENIIDYRSYQSYFDKLDYTLRGHDIPEYRIACESSKDRCTDYFSGDECLASDVEVLALIKEIKKFRIHVKKSILLPLIENGCVTCIIETPYSLTGNLNNEPPNIPGQYLVQVGFVRHSKTIIAYIPQEYVNIPEMVNKIITEKGDIKNAIKYLSKFESPGSKYDIKQVLINSGHHKEVYEQYLRFRNKYFREHKFIDAFARRFTNSSSSGSAADLTDIFMQYLNVKEIGILSQVAKGFQSKPRYPNCIYKVKCVDVNDKKQKEALIKAKGGFIYNTEVSDIISFSIAKEEFNKQVRTNLGLLMVSMTKVNKIKEQYIKQHIPLATIEIDPTKNNQTTKLITCHDSDTNRTILEEARKLSSKARPRFAI